MIAEKINQILVDEFEIEDGIISPDKNMKDTLELDSLDYVDLVVIIESNFGVKLTEADFSNIDTFQDFYQLVEQKRA